MKSTDAGARVQRHTRAARWLHGLTAVAMVMLLITGFALADVLPPQIVALLGGHAVMDAAHTALGLAFVALAAVAALARGRKTLALVRELGRFKRADAAWSCAFVLRLLHLRATVPDHAGRLDPLQRLVLALLLALAGVAAVSGVYLYWLPPAPRWVLVLAIRTHVYADWALLAVLALHVFAGLGLLRTHRGIRSSMFGDGTVPETTARRLWPRWTAAQRGQTMSSTTPPSTRSAAPVVAEDSGDAT